MVFTRASQGRGACASPRDLAQLPPALPSPRTCTIQHAGRAPDGHVGDSVKVPSWALTPMDGHFAPVSQTPRAAGDWMAIRPRSHASPAPHARWSQFHFESESG